MVQGTNFTSTSDESIKENVETAPQDTCSQIFQQIQAKTYSRTDGVEGKRIGFLAQDVQNALGGSDLGGVTNVVTRDIQRPSLLALDYVRLLPILWQVVKNQEARIAALEAGQSSPQ